MRGISIGPEDHVVPGGVAAAGGHDEKFLQLREGHRLEPGLVLENTPSGISAPMKKRRERRPSRASTSPKDMHVAKTIGQV